MPLYDPSYDPNDDYKTRHKKTASKGYSFEVLFEEVQ